MISAHRAFRSSLSVICPFQYRSKFAQLISTRSWFLAFSYARSRLDESAEVSRRIIARVRSG
jgi:hypothetical protein